MDESRKIMEGVGQKEGEGVREEGDRDGEEVYLGSCYGHRSTGARQFAGRLAGSFSRADHL